MSRRRHRSHALGRRYGHAIARIRAARITHYRDSGQHKAHIDWVDGKGRSGTTSGDPTGAHMQALLQRAEREGVTVRRETW
jgi:hypothetical protein